MKTVFDIIEFASAGTLVKIFHKNNLIFFGKTYMVPVQMANLGINHFNVSYNHNSVYNIYT